MKNASNRIFATLTIILLISVLGHAQGSYGPFDPSDMSNSGSGVDWTNPDNSKTSNNSYTTHATKGVTKNLNARSFGFSMLSTDVVEGIQLDVERKFVPGLAITRLRSWQETETSTLSSFNVPAGNERMLMVVIGAENGTTQATYSVAYNGTTLTRATSIVVNTGFTATLEVWYLKEANLPAGSSTANIVVTKSPYSSIEYFESVSATVFENVDQTSPFESFVQGSSSSNTASYQLPSAMNNAAGSMAFTAIFCGQNTSPTKTNGQTDCWTVNQSYSEQVDLYRSNASASTTGGCVQIAEKSYTVLSADQPTFTFAGSPNRRCALAISFRRSGVYDNTVKLLKNNVVVGANYALSSLQWPITDTYQAYGGPTDTWFDSWTPSDINNVNFGAIIAANVEQGTANVDHLRISVFYSSVLPLDLVNFSAHYQNEKTQLSWVTATEINSDRIEVERSEDGFDFRKIGSQSAAGTSTSPLLYEYEDDIVLIGLAYYRLKLIDKDGSFEYSDIRSVHQGEGTEMLFPNPVTDWATLISADIPNMCYVLDASGKHVSQIDILESNGSFKLNLADLPQGSYILLWSNQGENKILRFQKN